MKKMARPSYWDKIEGGLRKITNLPSSVHAVLGGGDKLKFHQSLPPGVNPNAKAWVTTEDANDDGKIETINFSIVNMEKEWPQDILSKINQMDESDPVFQDILNGVAKTLIHELAHIDDHKEGDFPGGEGIAESRENAFTPNFASSSITNTSNKVLLPLELSKNGDIKMKTEVIKLANHLDKLGHSDLADRLDRILKSANPMFDVLDEESSDALETDEELEANLSAEPVSFTAANLAQANADALSESGFDFESVASNNIDEMAKVISREFSHLPGGKVSR
jgi:hypothetical protein